MAERTEIRSQGKQRSWRSWALGAAVVVALIFIFQNFQEVKVKFLFIDTTTPLVFALLVAAILGAVIGYVAPLVRQRRRGA
jgi:uncharacterized integral membrane protein